MCHLFGIQQHIFGGSPRDEDGIGPRCWVQSPRARTALLHATNIQAIAAQLPLGLAYSVNVPAAVFAAATTYTAFNLAGVSKVVLPATIDWGATLTAQPEAVDPNLPMSDDTLYTHCFITGSFETMSVPNDKYVIRDLSYDLTALRTLLRGISLQWGVAAEMEQVVSAWIERCQ